MIAQNKTTSNRRPNALGLPGLIGKNSPFQGYPPKKFHKNIKKI